MSDIRATSRTARGPVVAVALSVLPVLTAVFCGSLLLRPGPARAQPASAQGTRHSAALSPETRALVELVQSASSMVAARGDEALAELRRPQSRFRSGELYVFVLDPAGSMLVHPDPKLEGRNVRGLTDVQGKPIIQGLIDTATATPKKTSGWYHYEWPMPGGLLPRWKSSFVQLAVTPAGDRRIVGAGLYNDRMEPAFVVDIVEQAAARLARDPAGTTALLRDPTGPFLAKDEYVFVLDDDGKAIVHPGFPNLEGKNLMDVEDSEGKAFVREMFDVAEAQGAGWVDYMWPKPGESASTQKSTYVKRVRIKNAWVLVGSGVYLADAPRAPRDPDKLTAPQLVSFVRDAAALLETRGADAFAELRREGSRWFRHDSYLFVWELDGTRSMHAADPTLEGTSGRDAVDVRGRPYGQMILDAARSPTGEGWVHYLYPEPGDIFPTWKSTFIRRVTLPGGEQRLVGSGVYNMELHPAFIVDVVQRATALVAQLGRDAFPLLRDARGPFRFMDVYVFVNSPDGVELVNPAQPNLEGVNLMGARDVNGKLVARDYIDVALRQGRGWVDYMWYRPGNNDVPVRKRTYVQSVRGAGETFIVGSGVYAEETRAPSGTDLGPLRR